MTDLSDLTRHNYLGFTLDEPEDHVAQLFARRYGRPPDHIVEALGILYVGPIPMEIVPCPTTDPHEPASRSS